MPALARVSVGAADTAAAEDEAPEAAAPAPAAGAEREPTPEAGAAEVKDAEAEDDADAESKDGADTEAESEEDTGPVFSVSDRRGSITADRTGIRFKLDGESAEFGWDEIGAVEIDTPRFGRRFSVTVYTSTRRWFDTDVEASSKPLLKTWAAELDAVLDTYFEDDKPEEAADAAGAAEVVEDGEPAKADEAEEADKVEDAEEPEAAEPKAKGKAKDVKAADA